MTATKKPEPVEKTVGEHVAEALAAHLPKRKKTFAEYSIEESARKQQQEVAAKKKGGEDDGEGNR